MKLRPLNVFSWKFLNSCAEHRDVEVDPAAIVLGADFDRIVGLGLELQVRTRCDDAWQPGWVGLTQTEPLPDSGGVPAAGSAARNSAERSRLKPPAL